MTCVFIRSAILRAGICQLLLFAFTTMSGQSPLITGIPSRSCTSLDGKWQYIIDPYETGFYDYRYQERKESDREAYWNSDVPDNKTDRKEHGYTDKYTLAVPGDWNAQSPVFTYYEGTVWYKKSFDFKRKKAGSRVFLYFGAVNYRADVYLNGRKLGMHKGGFTPFNFEIPDTLLKATNNYLVVKADNRRYAGEVPTLNTDWWNYGGITRSVMLVELPGGSAIRDYFIQLKPSSSDVVEGWVRLDGLLPGETVRVEIPALHIKKEFPVADTLVKVSFTLPAFRHWTPETPQLYETIISAGADRVREKIGFRTVSASGNRLLLNGQPVFLRGISIHGEAPGQGRRAWGRQDALRMLGWAKELGCNMVRLAHYPHDEAMTRMADSLGLLVWSEIPVYWTIDFSSGDVLAKATTQLHEMIARDHNRASIIVWSVGNETPVSETRTNFMKTLLQEAKREDAGRLVSAALEVNYNSGQNMRVIDDPLGAYVDIVAFNQYLGWYSGTPASCRTARWSTIYDKPLFISETGAEALGGFHADSLTIWSEEYQAWYYREQVAMLKKMPEEFTGISPWILADFRSPRRNNPRFQEGWNNKGLIDHQGRKKKSFFILRDYYTEMKQKNAH